MKLLTLLKSIFTQIYFTTFSSISPIITVLCIYPSMRMISMLLSTDLSTTHRNLIYPSTLLIFMLASYMRCCRFLWSFYGLA